MNRAILIVATLVGVSGVSWFNFKIYELISKIPELERKSEAVDRYILERQKCR